MALSDIELLDLAERAANGKKGERGPEGTGIRSIQSPSPDLIVFTLTDGTKYEHRIPLPKDGEPGAPGAPGKDGAGSSTPGPRGPAGEPGRDGKDGVGIPGASVDSCLVDSRGHLLVGLTNGSVIDAGRAVGPAGLSGDRGPTGLPGERGRDGNTLLSGYQAPNDSEDGQDGDFYIDLSSPQLDFYGPKTSGAWGPRTTFLKQPPAQQNIPGRSFLAGGGSGGGGGGGLPPFEVQMPANVETEVARFSGDQAILIYRVNDAADTTVWSAGQFNTAAMELVDDAEFTISSELYGIGGDIDLLWRVQRDPGNFNLMVITVRSAVAAFIRGRIVTAA